MTLKALTRARPSYIHPGFSFSTRQMAFTILAETAPGRLFDERVMQRREATTVSRPYRFKQDAMALTAIVCPGSCRSAETGARSNSTPADAQTSETARAAGPPAARAAAWRAMRVMEVVAPLTAL